MVERIRLRVHSSKRRRLVVFVTALLLVTVVICVFFLNKDEILKRGLVFFDAPVAGDLNPVRGPIYDRNYKELAVSLDKVSVYSRTREVVNHQKVASLLAPILGKDETELMGLFKSDSLRVWLAKNINQQQEDAIQSRDIAGIYLHRENERYYPQKQTAAHLIGFVEDEIGLAGVEYHFNRLINEYGIVRGSGFSNQHKEEEEELDEDGDHYLVLTVDLKIQKILEEYLASLSIKYPKSKVGVALMDITSGDIIGVGDAPSFDPNRFRDYRKEDLASSLAEPIAIPTMFRTLLGQAAYLQAQYEKSGKMMPWSLLSGSGNISSQVRLWEKLEFNENLDLDFVVRKKSETDIERLRSAGEFDLQTVPEVATPLHLLTAYARLVNGGRKVVPHVVDRLRNKWGEEVAPEAARLSDESEGVVEKDVSQEFSRLLAAQMEEGPLASGFLEGQSHSLLNRDGGQEVLRNRVLLSCIPASKPKLLLLVSLTEKEFGPESAKKGKTKKSTRKKKGKTKNTIVEVDSVLTAPAKKIISSLVIRQEVMKDLIDMMGIEARGDENYKSDESRKKKSVTKEVDDLPARLRAMPDLRGYSLRKSLRMLQAFQLDIKIEGTGVVVAQKPNPGAVMGSTKQCTIILERRVPESQGRRK